MIRSIRQVGLDLPVEIVPNVYGKSEIAEQREEEN
jgi:hypothetical protein